MPYDLVIRNGRVVDGSGLPSFRADVAVQDGLVVEIGRISGSATETLDADGLVVSPGFIDAHTHMDAQIAWDPLGTSSCWLGVTSVIMGNCGFTLAPCRPQDRELFIRSLEAVEDIPAEAMLAGIDWRWENYAEYLDHLAGLNKGINYGGYVGHSALRVHAMGERAFTEAANEDDVAVMRREVGRALDAGAFGFSTSRQGHLTPWGTPVPSRVAGWGEVQQLAAVLREKNQGLVQVAGKLGRDLALPENREDLERCRSLALDLGRPVTWGIFSDRAGDPDDSFRKWYDVLRETSAAGGRMFAQMNPRPLTTISSFRMHGPFDSVPEWHALGQQPIAALREALSNPESRSRLAAAAKGAAPELRMPNYERFWLLDEAFETMPSVAQLAQAEGKHPVDYVIDVSLASDFDQFFIGSQQNYDEAHRLEMLRDPHSAVTFSDSGAHVQSILDSSMQTYVLAHFVRQRQALSLEAGVRLITFDIASRWGIRGRGLLREGYAADINVFDPNTIGAMVPEVADDLPSGAKRLRQKGRGIVATVVNGEITFRNGEHTGKYAGQVLRAASSVA